MSRTISISDEQYHMLEQLAAVHAQTPEQALASAVDDAWEHARELSPDCVKRPEPSGPAGQRYTARELMKLPREERNRILAQAAAGAAEEYRTNPELTEFEAFGEDDLYDEYPDER